MIFFKYLFLIILGISTTTSISYGMNQKRKKNDNSHEVNQKNKKTKKQKKRSRSEEFRNRNNLLEDFYHNEEADAYTDLYEELETCSEEKINNKDNNTVTFNEIEFILKLNLNNNEKAEDDDGSKTTKIEILQWILAHLNKKEMKFINDYKPKGKEFLIGKNNIDFNRQDENGNTFAHYACSEIDLDMIKFLLSNKADLNYKNKFGNTPFHILLNECCNSTDTQALELILPYTNATIQNNNGSMPLHLACNHSYACYQEKEKNEMVKNHILRLMLHLDEKQVNPYFIINNQGMIPLHCAIKNANFNIVEMLVFCFERTISKSLNLHHQCLKKLNKETKDSLLNFLLCIKKNQEKFKIKLPKPIIHWILFWSKAALKGYLFYCSGINQLNAFNTNVYVEVHTNDEAQENKNNLDKINNFLSKIINDTLTQNEKMLIKNYQRSINFKRD